VRVLEPADREPEPIALDEVLELGPGQGFQLEWLGDLGQGGVVAGEGREIPRVAALVDAEKDAAPMRPADQRTPALSIEARPMLSVPWANSIMRISS
jgi:hypothetical protein